MLKNGEIRYKLQYKSQVYIRTIIAVNIRINYSIVIFVR